CRYSFHTVTLIAILFLSFLYLSEERYSERFPQESIPDFSSAGFCVLLTRSQHAACMLLSP
ncbi:hypothetical protein, partial [Neglectibacter timonensis]